MLWSRRLCDFYEPQASTLGIVVRTHFSPDLPRPGHRRRPVQAGGAEPVLNAEHAMAEGGELILTTRRDGRWIVLDVIDTGAGMPEDVRPGSSTPSTRPAPAAAAWACRPRGRSSRPTAGRSRSTASRARARGSRSACRCRRLDARVLMVLS